MALPSRRRASALASDRLGGLPSGSGWSFLGLLVLCPILFIAMLAVGGIVIGATECPREASRLLVRTSPFSPSWHAAIIGFGFFLSGVTGWFAVAGILLSSPASGSRSGSF